MLTYERHPLNLKLAFDAAPNTTASSGPDTTGTIGKLLRIVRRNLDDDEWMQLGDLLKSGGAEDDADTDAEKRADNGTKHIERANGDPTKLLAPRKPIKAGSVGEKDVWAQDARRYPKTAAEKFADERNEIMLREAIKIRNDASLNKMFPDAARLTHEPGYGLEHDVPARPKATSIAASNSYAEMFPNADKNRK